MLSIEIVRNKNLSRRVESSARSHRAVIAQGLADFYAPFAPEDHPLPDFDTFIRLQEWVLRHHRLDLQVKDRAHEAELQNDKELRRLRDAAAKKLHSKLGEIFETFDGTYGQGRCVELLGFSTGLRAEPKPMLELAEKAVERLSAPGFELPTPQLDGVELSTESLEAQLVAPLTDLAAAMRALEHEKDKFDATVIAKTSAAKDQGRVYVRLSRLLEELYRIAGQDELADRMRPPTHRAKKAADEETAAADPATESDDEASGSSKDDEAGSSDDEASGSSEDADSEDAAS